MVRKIEYLQYFVAVDESSLSALFGETGYKATTVVYGRAIIIGEKQDVEDETPLV